MSALRLVFARACRGIAIAATVLLICPEFAAAQKHWLLDAADRAQANNEYDSAIQALQAYQLIANKPDIWLRIGELLDRRNRVTEAIDAYERYEGTDPGTVADVKKRIESLSLRAEERSISESLAESSHNTELATRAFREGRQLIIAKNHAEGLGYLQAATFLDPDLPGPYRLLGATYLKIGKSDAATRHLAEYLRIRPDGTLADKVRKLLEDKDILGRLDAQASYPCDVWVNSRYMGKVTPVQGILLPKGYHIVAFVNAKHHLVKTFRIRIEPNHAVAVNFRYGVMRINLEPWGRIRANGRDLGLWDQLGLPTGSYKLEVRSHDGSRSGSTIWKVESGQERLLTWQELS